MPQLHGGPVVRPLCSLEKFACGDAVARRGQIRPEALGLDRRPVRHGRPRVPGLGRCQARRPLVASPPPSALSAAERQALDLGRYVVTDPSASYFDVEARLAFLRDTSDPLLRAAAERLGAEVDCEEKLALPVIDYELRLPSFYEEPEAWRAAIEPLFAFEDAVSDLAAAFVATDADHFADCLLDLLRTWANADALARFHYEDERSARHGSTSRTCCSPPGWGTRWCGIRWSAAPATSSVSTLGCHASRRSISRSRAGHRAAATIISTVGRCTRASSEC